MWDYPAYNEWSYLLHVIVIGYPFVAFFSLDIFVYLQKSFLLKQKIVLPTATILFGYANEIPNLFAHEWVYKNWLFGDFMDIPIFVSVLWLMLLVVLLFKRFFFE